VADVKVVKSKNEKFVLGGFMTSVHVDLEGCPLLHGLTIKAVTEDDVALRKKAKL
jgi:hypothetical protein